MIMNHGRIASVGDVFRELGLEGVRKFEVLDKQMDFAKGIAGSCGDAAPLLIAVNATVSYMLMYKGETHWALFSDFVRRKCPKSFTDTVEIVKEFTAMHNKRYLRAKLSRLEKLKKCSEIGNSILESDLRSFWNNLAACLEVRKDSKTVVFAVKMCYYGLMALGKRVELPAEAPIPVDRRVSLITVTSGMVLQHQRQFREELLKNVKAVSAELMKKPKLVQRVWSGVSTISGIPQLHLDAPAWVIGAYIELGRKSLVLEELRKRGITSNVGEDVITRLVDELLHVFPP